MPFGGKYQRTPAQAMAAKIPVQDGETDDCSVFAYGCNPALAAQNPYAGAYTAVVDSLSRLVASGASAADAYLIFPLFLFGVVIVEYVRAYGIVVFLRGIGL